MYNCTVTVGRFEFTKVGRIHFHFIMQIKNSQLHKIMLYPDDPLLIEETLRFMDEFSSAR